MHSHDQPVLCYRFSNAHSLEILRGAHKALIDRFRVDHPRFRGVSEVSEPMTQGAPTYIPLPALTKNDTRNNEQLGTDATLPRMSNRRVGFPK
jgi:hypothetical protein